MKSSTDRLLKTGILLLLIGVFVFLIGSVALDFDYSNLDVHEYATQNYFFEEDFSSVMIADQASSIHIKAADDGFTHIELLEDAALPHSVTITDGALLIQQPKEQKWNLLNFHFKKTFVNVYLPREKYDVLNVETATGDVTLTENIRFNSLDIDASTGDITLKNQVADDIRLSLSTGDILLENVDARHISLRLSTGKTRFADVTAEGAVNVKSSTGKVFFGSVHCSELDIKTSTGDVSLSDTVASGHLSVECSTGSIHLKGVDAASLRLSARTGDIKGSILTPKRYEAHTDTGDVDVPSSSPDGELCRITTTTGDISIDVMAQNTD